MPRTRDTRLHRLGLFCRDVAHAVPEERRDALLARYRQLSEGQERCGQALLRETLQAIPEGPRRELDDRVEELWGYRLCTEAL